MVVSNMERPWEHPARAHDITGGERELDPGQWLSTRPRARPRHYLQHFRGLAISTITYWWFKLYRRRHCHTSSHVTPLSHTTALMQSPSTGTTTAHCHFLVPHHISKSLLLSTECVWPAVTQHNAGELLGAAWQTTHQLRVAACCCCCRHCWGSSEHVIACSLEQAMLLLRSPLLPCLIAPCDPRQQ
jgi:hypothetical protein